MPISIPLKLCLYLVLFLRYSASNNGVTLKSGKGSFKVTEYGAVQQIISSYTYYYWSAILSIALSCTICELVDIK